MGLGMILSALSSGGNATANVGHQYGTSIDNEAMQERQFEHQDDMERLRSQLNIEQAARIAENQRTAAAEPLNRFSGMLRAKAAEEQPVFPAEVTSLSGGGTDSGLPGLHGDPNKLAEWAANLPPGEIKDLAVKQLNQQLDHDQLAASQAVDGQTKKRTPEEAMAAALDDAKMNDPTAYLAGKTLGPSGDKYMQVTANGAVIDTTTGKVIYENTAGGDNARLAAETKLRIAEAGNASDKEIAQLRLDVAKASGGNTPSIVATANWLVEQGIAKTPAEAWVMAKTGAAKAGSDNIVKIAGILAGQPGYKPQSNTGKGRAADLFADAAALEKSYGGAVDGAPAAAPSPVAAAAASVPTTGAIDYLKKNPQLRGQFDAKYGPGAAQKYLGG